MSNPRTTGSRVLVEVDEGPAQSAGGILFPQQFQRHKRQTTGRVVSAGAGAIKLGLAVGQRVAFNPLQGQEVEWEGRSLRLLGVTGGRFSDVIGILEEKSVAEVADL